MKKCPTCDMTFEDSMRFCQVDGTLLVEDEPAFDPYATIVGRPAGDLDASGHASPASGEAQTHQTVGSMPISAPDEVLDLPEADPLKTIYASDSEMREALDNVGNPGTDDIVELPPIGDTARPEPKAPDFNMPAVPAPDLGSAPPPSPFSEPLKSQPESAADRSATLDEQATVYQSTPGLQSGGATAPMAEWTPPPAPDPNWQNRGIDANTPFQPPMTGLSGQNKILPIISLVLGVLSLCCYISPLTGLAALVTGFLGIKNVNADPSQYGGKGLAIAGMILGGLFFIVGVIFYIVLISIGPDALQQWAEEQQRMQRQ